MLLDRLASLQDVLMYTRIPIFFNVAEIRPDLVINRDTVLKEGDFIDGIKYFPWLPSR